MHEMRGGGAAAGERLDVIAQQEYGDPAYWRLIASFNELDRPDAVPAGTRLALPPTSVLESAP